MRFCITEWDTSINISMEILTAGPNNVKQQMLSNARITINGISLDHKS